MKKTTETQIKSQWTVKTRPPTLKKIPHAITSKLQKASTKDISGKAIKISQEETGEKVGGKNFFMRIVITGTKPHSNYQYKLK